MESKILYKVNVINHSKIEDHIEYVVSVENLKNGINITFTERYSSLRNLHELMKKEASGKNFPPFPPKKFFGAEDEKFVLKREKDLNTFFESINTDENLANLPSFIKFIEDNLKKNSNKEKISSRKIQYSIQFKNSENDFKSFLEEKRLTPEEFKKECLEGKKIAEKFSQKFVSLNYDIEVNSKEQNEKKYENIIKENKIFISDETNMKIIENGTDGNFILIGKDEEITNLIENKLKKIINQNLEIFYNMSKMMNIDEFLLK